MPEITPLSGPDFEPVLTKPREPSPSRIPNLGHALIFIGFAGLLLLLSQLALILKGYSPASLQKGVITLQHPKAQLAAMAATYLATLAAAWLFFPALWHRRFLDGIRWHWETARRQAPRLIALGLCLGGSVQIVTYFIPTPKTLPIDDFFNTQLNAWLITLFGTVMAPVFEEICFRGFLVPAFAIAYDWLRLPRTPEAHQCWRTTTALTPPAFLFSAILSSVFFALLHAEQLANLRPALLVLFSVSLVLTYVRIKTDSVACSTIVHSAYNSFVFLTVLIATGGYRHLDRLTR
jgi:membrane protease YdiL (CAAX protease family)